MGQISSSESGDWLSIVSNINLNLFYLQVHPEAKPYRTLPFQHFDELSELYDKKRAIGSFAQSVLSVMQSEDSDKESTTNTVSKRKKEVPLSSQIINDDSGCSGNKSDIVICSSVISDTNHTMIPVTSSHSLNSH